MSAQTTDSIRCSRCRRSYAEAGDQAEWNAVLDRGVLRAVYCPGCQSPAESVEASVNQVLRGSRSMTRGADGLLRVLEPGAWTRVAAASHPLVQDDPDIHLALTVREGCLLVAVAGHSDAGLVSALAPGPCAEVAAALAAAETDADPHGACDALDALGIAALHDDQLARLADLAHGDARTVRSGIEDRIIGHDEAFQQRAQALLATAPAHAVPTHPTGAAGTSDGCESHWPASCCRVPSAVRRCGNGGAPVGNTS
ncbi:hypothetical protein [Streptomyces sp. CBMA156]|uniref:hypothetical protein n=1 Tax=Streptomyces sp. CBMA156 TaxID=1930280 RepID=UPI00166191ED|nr:hypothetical protein [Streptomyces sp. CBMA156]MBD0673902.1 hypothetical protein [Streptomyces sp. CBMA156]